MAVSLRQAQSISDNYLKYRWTKYLHCYRESTEGIQHGSEPPHLNRSGSVFKVNGGEGSSLESGL